MVGATLSALGQTVLTQTSPTLQPSPLPPLVPTFPALPIIPGQPGLTNSTTTAGPAAPSISDQLTNLQNEIQMILPALATFNDGFDFFSITGGQPGATVNGSGQTTGISGGVPLGTGAAVTPGAGLGSVTTNSTGPLPGFAAFPLTRETLRALLVVQNDLERLLPLLNALNAGSTLSSVALNPVLLPMGFTNIFGGVTDTGSTGTTNGP